MNLHLNFFVQSLVRYDKISDLWDEVLFITYHNNGITASDVYQMSFFQREHFIKKIKKWVEQENKQSAGKKGLKPAKVRRR